MPHQQHIVSVLLYIFLSNLEHSEQFLFQSDVELVVHKEKLRKAKPKFGLATLQPKEHDAWSFSVAIVSAMPIDDKLVVLVSDKPIEVKPLIDEKKDIPVCVSTGGQTNDSCADTVPVHMVPWAYDHRHYVSAPVRHFVGAAVRMHTSKDGCVHQLCGLGITHLLLGRAKAGSCSARQGSNKS
jgi:hypothetical protein